MIRFISTAMIVLGFINATAQTGVAINTNGAAPAAAALLDVSSTNKGVLIPRMNSAQRKLIANPEQGLMVYDIDKATFYFYDGVQWRPLSFTTENRLALIERKPTATEDATSGLGHDVAMFGVYAAASAPHEKVGNNWDQGCIYMYAHQNNSWNLLQKLSADDGMNGDFFGCSIAMYNDLLVVGASHATTNGLGGNGAVYIFKRSGQVWAQVKKLLPPVNEINGWFGFDVSVYNGKILVGAPYKTVGGKSGAGVAYLYEPLNNDWQLIKEFKATAALSSANFAYSVRLYGNDAVIGYPGNIANNLATGSVQVFSRSSPAASWQEKTILPAGPQDDMRFGRAVDIYMDTLIVGAPTYDYIPNEVDEIWAGRYERWVRTNGNWIFVDSETGRNKYQGMGNSVAVNGPYQFVYKGPTGVNHDAQVDGTGPAFLRNYRDIDLQPNSGFGSGIAISGNHFIIGASIKNNGGGSVQFGNMD